MTLSLFAAPAVEPVDLAFIKTMLGITSSAEDGRLDYLILSARQELDGADGRLGRALITQTWDYVLDGFPFMWEKPFAGYRWDAPQSFLNQSIMLPLRPVQLIVSITYRDTDGSSQTMDAADYILAEGDPASLMPVNGKSWPSTELGRGVAIIRFICGYGDTPEDIPYPIRMAIVEMVSQKRGTVGRDPALRSETVDGVGSWSYDTGRTIGMSGDIVSQRLQQYIVGGIS